MPHHPYHKADHNADPIVKELKTRGWTVVNTGRVGAGFPDLIACKHGRIEFIEIKGPKGKLTDDQRRFHIDMANCGITVKVIRDIEDAVRL